MKPTIIQITIVILFCAGLCLAQQPSQTPPPSATGEEPIKISTEEVHLNVLARSTSAGQFVSTLKKEDLLVVEDGTPQDVTGVKRVPANVMLMIDTGANLNLAKTLNASRVIAQIFVYSLPANNSLSVAQYNDKVETIADWNNDYSPAIQALETKLISGSRVRFTAALEAAMENFRSRPVENRHLVLITDGVETVADDEARRNASGKLLAANITVHVISFTDLEQKLSGRAGSTLKLGDGKKKPRIDPLIYENIIRGMAMGKDGRDAVRLRARLRQLNEAQDWLIVNVDLERAKRMGEKREVWKRAEGELQSVSEDAGGIFRAPEDLDGMFKLATEIAKAVDSQYVVTYMPKKPFRRSGGGGGAAESENRKVRVSTYCEGVEIQSRQKLTVIP